MVSYYKGGKQVEGIWEQGPRRIFGPKKDEHKVWKALHSEELYCWYNSLNIARTIKYRSLRWIGRVARGRR